MHTPVRDWCEGHFSLHYSALAVMPRCNACVE